MDRGIVSEDNLDSLRERKAAYIVGTPKGQLRQFEGQLLDEHDWSQVQPGIEVKLLAHPDLQGKEQYVIARSVDRAEKESAMLAQSKARLQAKLEQIDASLQKRPAKLGTIERRIGRWMGRYSRAERFYQVTSERPRLPSPQPAPSEPPHANHGRRLGHYRKGSTAHLG